MKMTKDQLKIFNIGKYDGLNMNAFRHFRSYKFRIYHKGYDAGIKELQMTSLLRGTSNVKADWIQRSLSTGKMALLK